MPRLDPAPEGRGGRDSKRGDEGSRWSLPERGRRLASGFGAFLWLVLPTTGHNSCLVGEVQGNSQTVLPDENFSASVSVVNMAQPRHLPHAPITEAVIDLRAQTAPGLDVQSFANLSEKVGYGEAKEINLFEFGFHQVLGKSPETHQLNHGRIGFRYASGDEKYVAQFRKDGFTFSRLAPYTHWDEVFAEASRLYRVYVETANPEEITRIAVRYINRMLLPEEEVKDFSPFLTAPPPFPKELTAFITGFLTQVQVQDPGTNIGGTITQTIQQGAGEPGKVPVILDLDIFELGSKSPEPEALLNRFAALRDVKNRYFFSSITDRTVELYL